VPSRPNMVFVHVDQLHHEVLSAYGCPDVQTPNMDRIAAEGYSFMESHATMPMCSPARASWFTGRMSKEHGCIINGFPILPDLPDLGQWLRKHGYDAVYTGKWHVTGRKVAESFDILVAGSSHGELGDSDVARSAVAFLQNRKSDKPFFLSAGFLNPHDCCFAFTDKANGAKYGFAEQIPDQLPSLSPDFEDIGGRDWSEQDWRYYRYAYFRMVEMVDREVGRIYDAVRRSPFADNTLFIFCADHGDGLGHHGHVAKGRLDEWAWRVSTIVSWPGVVQAGVRDHDHLVTGVDIPATVCDYAEMPLLPKMTFARSWRPLLEGKETEWRDHVIGETSRPTALAVRTADYKTIFDYDQPTRLYNITKDPLEMKDLAEDPAMKEVLAEHHRLAREFIQKAEIQPEPENPQLLHGKNLYPEYIELYARLTKEEVTA